MAQIPVKFFKVLNPPAEPAEPNAVYFVQPDAEGPIDVYVTSADGDLVACVTPAYILSLVAGTIIPLSYLDADGTLAANSDQKVATQKAVNTKVATAIAGLINAAPGALDTLDELAAAMGDDANFAATVASALALKEAAANKDTSGGYVGLSGWAIKFRNLANTFTSLFQNANTAVRTYTFQDRNGTLADDSDLALKAPLANPTFTGQVTLAENAAVVLDPALSADGKYTGITRSGTAGAALAFGDLCYLDPTDSRWELADVNAAAGADGDARGILGICVLTAAADGDPTTMLLVGNVRADVAFPAMTINKPMYASETAGDITETQPTTTDAVIRIVGVALTADELYFNPSMDYITHV